MRYDSSMTNFHDNIVSAIKSMIHGDIDKVAELAAEGSPVPLRDYLRNQHGRSCHGGNNFDCMSSAFLVVFDHMINNDGDTKLQLSWSQTGNFIRKYPSEFFSEDEPADDDILPDKNSLELLCNTFDESKIKCPFWQTGKTLHYLSFGGVNFKCDYCECSFCEFDRLTSFLASHCHNYEDCLYYRKHKDDKSDFPCDDCGYDDNGCCNYPDTPEDYCICGDKQVPKEETSAAPPTKYTEAVQLNAQIMTSARAAQQNLYDMAMGFKKMRDEKLYKELGYDNFGDYCEGETGMKRKNVYRYIDVVEKLPLDFVSSMTQIGMTKLQLLTTVDEEHRTEIIENTDLESTTVKELREQIEQLKQSETKAKSQLDHVNTAYEDMYNSCMRNKKMVEEQVQKNNALQQQTKELESQLSEAKESLDLYADDVRKAEERAEYAENKATEISVKKHELEMYIKELESRPRDVAVDTEELNRRLTEASDKLQRQAAEQIAEERRDFSDKLNRMEEERDRLEQKIAELENSSADSKAKDREIAELKQRIERMSDQRVKTFAIKLTVEEFEELMNIVKKSGNAIISAAVKKAHFIRI